MKKLVLASLLYVLNVAATLCTPVAIFALLKWVEQSDAGAGEGVGYVLALAVAACSAFVAEERFDHMSHAAGIQCRSSVLGILYEKVLSQRMVDVASSGAASDEAPAINDERTAVAPGSQPTAGASAGGSGEVLNLFGVDAAALEELWTGILTLILQPIEILAIVGVLYVYVQEAAFGGVLVVMVALGIAGAGSAKVETLVAERAKETDVRIRDMNEMLLGMKVVKLNAWEGRFADLIRASRGRESRLSRRQGIHFAYINPTASNSVDVISLAVIIIYTYGLGNVLDAATVFTYWVLLGMLHGRIFHYPVALRHSKEGLASLRRLQSFLMRQVTEDKRIITLTTPAANSISNNALPAGTSVCIDRATFSWAADYTSTATAAGDNHKTAAVSSSITSSSLPISIANPLHNNLVDTGRSRSNQKIASAAVTADLLQDISIDVASGELCCIVGSVGTGKSSLLMALLGEMNQPCGEMRMAFSSPSAPENTASEPVTHNLTSAGASTSSSAASMSLSLSKAVALVPQTTWIITGTMRDNIVFGRAFDAEWYQTVVNACALDHDFAQFPEGDATHVAVFTLSGGQKQRLSIARACYGRKVDGTSLFLFDDILSALDQRVGAHVLHNVVADGGILGGSTRILVTNTPAALNHCAKIVYLSPIRSVAPSTAPAGSVAATGWAHSAPPSPELKSTRVTSAFTTSFETDQGVSEVVVPSSSATPSVTVASERSKRSTHGPFTAIFGAREDMLRHPALAAIMSQLGAGGPSIDDIDVSAPAVAPVLQLKNVSGHVAGDGAAGIDDDGDRGVALSPYAASAAAAKAASEAEELAREHAGLGADRNVAALPAPIASPSSVSSLQLRPAAPASAVARSAPATMQASAAAAIIENGSSKQGADDAAVDEIVRPSIPFWSSWLLGAGGAWFGFSVVFWLLLEAAFVEVSVFVLAFWSEDSSANDPKADDQSKFSFYLALYGGAIVLELLSAYVRQHLYACGTVRASDQIHEALLFRICHAPQSYFDTHSGASILHWFSRDLDSIDKETFYASEYFWLGLVYGGLVVIIELYVTAWVIVPFVPVALSMWFVMRAPARRRVLAAIAAEKRQRESSAALSLPQVTDAEQEKAATSSVSAPSSVNVSALTSSAVAASGTSKMRAASGLSANVASAAASPSAVGPVAVPMKWWYRWLSKLYLPDVGERMVAESEAKAPLNDHFSATLDGLVSIRAYGAAQRFTSMHHSFVDGHSRSLEAVADAHSVQVLVANMIGALYYIGSTAIIVPLRLSGGIAAGDAGFIIVNSCFSSYMSQMVIQQRAALTSLALTRGTLVKAICTLPQEASVTDDAGTEAESRNIDKQFMRYYKMMLSKRSPTSEDKRRKHKSASYTSTAASASGTDGQHVELTKGGAKTALSTISIAVPAASRALAVPPAAWPSEGRVMLRDLCMRYREDAPLVLKGVNVEIKPGQHVGICGRTGAGKSSIIATITRLVEPCAGSIEIDGVDVTRIPLSSLRPAVTVISQDPLFFSGSLRRNLDPFSQFTDVELVKALKRVRLYDFAASNVRGSRASQLQSSSSARVLAVPSMAPGPHTNDDGSAGSASVQSGADDAGAGSSNSTAAAASASADPLNMTISERGSNLSIGQQQLLALARAMLRKPKVVCLDEATASLDSKTEAMVNATVHESFADSTVIQIAHRLVSVIECDVVVVMADGKVAEAAHPWELLNHSTAGPGAAATSNGDAATTTASASPPTTVGIFASMVASLPGKQREELYARAKAAFARRR